MSDERVKVVFINYGPYAGCSGVHIHFLANALTELGHECMVCLPNLQGCHKHFGEVKYPIHSFNTMMKLPIEEFAGGVIHAWTPREYARVPALLLKSRIDLPYLVHLEDNEIEITAEKVNAPTLEAQKALALKNPDVFKGFYYTHPLFFEQFMRESSGVTCIIKKLEEFVPDGVPRMTFWPACEDIFYNIPEGRDDAARALCDFSDDTTLFVYPGAVHAHNAESFVEYLLALEQLSQEGFAVKLLRVGIEYDEYDERALELYNKHVIYGGIMEASKLPAFVGLADILVQPGNPGYFDDYRFPSKLPFFLASGRPVLLPNTNVGEALKHGQECFLLQTGKADEIVKYLRILIEHKDIAKKMGQQGRAAARRLFSWTRAAQSLVPFYLRAGGL